MLKKYSFLLLIFVLAIFLRFWQLGDIPPGVHTDEADTGYSAYSILKTGLDPHGNFNLLALSDNNTGGTHPPLYTYLLLPLVKFFGLNIFVERMPSAILGSLTVLLIFFLVTKLFRSNTLANLTTFLFAVNPWAIHISRQGLLEAESLFFVMFGIVLFLYSDKKKYLLIFSAISFGLSLYAYDAPKIFLPPFLLLLFYFCRLTLFKIKKIFIAFILIFSLFYISVLQLTFVQGDIADYNRSSIFNDVAQNVDSERFQTNAPLWLSSIFHNKLSVSLKRLETSYASVFSLNWLFVNGSGNLQHAVGRHGQFFLFELPFFFIGTYLVFKKNPKIGIFLLGWMLIGALPGGLTNGNYAYRSIHMLPIPIVFSSVGVVWLWELLSKKKTLQRAAAKLLLIGIMGIYISSYLVTYFFDYPVYASEPWNKEQNDVIRFATEEKDKYKTIFIDGGEPWAIEYAFFNKIDPHVYQDAYRNIKTFNGKEVIHIDNIYFGIFQLEYVSTPSAFFPKNSMFITNANNFPKMPYIKSFKDPGKVRDIFKVFEVR
ncbi:MAG: phospholipid carrier-dependent glycosyltransferase [Candidatus Levybacteria bacterium]|nr:phospholipid carrier-dependent glycosyltransferase [Candidatus Levybacteria bacterium]